MIASLLAQHDSEPSAVSCMTDSHNAAKHVAACDKARHAYLRSIYGYQPTKGAKLGKVVDATIRGKVVTIEVRLSKRGKPRTGTFQLPVHVFKKNGKRLTCSNAFEDLVGRAIVMKVEDRYELDGYYFSNVSTVAVLSYFYVSALGNVMCDVNG